MTIIDLSASAHSSPAFTRQCGGSHYVTMKMQPTYFATINGYDPSLYSILKYLSRDGRKHEGPIDLDKAIHFVELREELKRDPLGAITFTRIAVTMQDYIHANSFYDPALEQSLQYLDWYSRGLTAPERLIDKIEQLRKFRYGV